MFFKIINFEDLMFVIGILFVVYLVGILPALTVGLGVSFLKRKIWWQEALQVLALGILVSFYIGLFIGANGWIFNSGVWMVICCPAALICWCVVRWLSQRRNPNQPSPAPSIEAP